MQYSLHGAVECAEVNDDREVEIQIAPVGKWKHPTYGDIEITEDHCKQAADYFSTVGAEVQMNYEHQRGAASGWIKRLTHKAGKGLFGLVKFTKKCAEMVRDGEYKYISPELIFNGKDKKSGSPVPVRVYGAAVTNTPYFDGMQPLSNFGESREPAWYFTETQVDCQTPEAGKEKNVMDKETLEKMGIVIKGEEKPEEALLQAFTEQKKRNSI
ncbi:MAG: phage protease, partial [Patescibacteria group bacterium]|nr:phage protease [Patescibacteria group bacterium]